MNTPPNKDIVIIGAGLIGSLLGVTLQKLGYNVSIYERYSDIRSIPSIGRSINLVLTSRGSSFCFFFAIFDIFLISRFESDFNVRK